MLVRDRLRQFIRDTFYVEDFADEDSFLANGIIDSRGVMQLVTFLEAEFGLRVDDADLLPENFDSVARLAAYVERRRLAA
jgi:acyl carrier protein